MVNLCTFFFVFLTIFLDLQSEVVAAVAAAASFLVTHAQLYAKDSDHVTAHV